MSVQFAEYPKALSHPEMTAENCDRFPPVTVNTASEEAQWRARGYVPNGVSDPEAVQRASAGTETGYKPIEFPQWVGDKIAHNPAERAAILEARGKV